jgi:hypothetical protein
MNTKTFFSDKKLSGFPQYATVITYDSLQYVTILTEEIYCNIR